MQGPRPLEDGAKESARAHRPCLRRLVPVRGPCSPSLCLPRPGCLAGHLSLEAEACNSLPGARVPPESFLPRIQLLWAPGGGRLGRAA